jgi:hypothetical protein
MTWVRANRPRLVAACLTLCQAWIAAGKPRGTRTIGSYENWSQIIGGVLEVAGIPGFLGNRDEMMDASDSEGTAWRAFVSGWWDRFGTAEVGTVDLFAVALTLEPPLPLGTGNDQSQRVRLGKALPKMRDRIFRCREHDLRLTSAGKYQGAARWKLQIVLPTEVAQGLPAGNPVRVGEAREGCFNNPHEVGLNKINGLRDSREGREGREFFPDLTRARTRANSQEDPGKPSRPSRPSPEEGKSMGYDLEGVRQHPHDPHQPSRADRSGLSEPPDWLRDVTE